jgi:hypothetical protein
MLSINTQTITCNPEMPVGWGTHIDGAAALLRFRDKQSLNEPFSQRLYLYVRRAIVSLLSLRRSYRQLMSFSCRF